MLAHLKMDHFLSRFSRDRESRQCLRRSNCCRFQHPQGSPSAEGAGWLSPCWSSSRSARRWRPQIVASPNPCLIYLDSRKCLTTDIELDSFTEWWKHIIWWKPTIWCWSIISWFIYIISSHKTRITVLYKQINLMTFHHIMISIIYHMMDFQHPNITMCDGIPTHNDAYPPWTLWFL